ncbi:hypothetical protein BJ912DRAFT_1063640 [Pholiota molesta]|nr:hypothetical protein BJ912DRAFT_1063640 [Pholiota molesta]
MPTRLLLMSAAAPGRRDPTAPRYSLSIYDEVATHPPMKNPNPATPRPAIARARIAHRAASVADAATVPAVAARGPHLRVSVPPSSFQRPCASCASSAPFRL